MRKFLLTFCLFVFVPGLIWAQSHVIHGVIHVFDSIPLIGVEVTAKSSKLTVKTDSLGQFVISCNEKDKLKIKANGYYNQNVNIDPEVKLVAINMKMKPGEKQREYAIGYGHASERDRIAAISNVTNKDSDFSRYNNMYDLIRSHLGVQVIRGEVIVRGDKTFQGNNAALIVVDGALFDGEILRTMSPLDVKSISVIKDGNSAVYGSRGVNGVVIIETKKGGD